MAARRTAATGTPNAAASPSCTCASRAPWRSSPDTRPASSRCSAAVARPNRSRTAAVRAAAEPVPARPATAAKAASTSATVSDGSAAGGGASCRVRQPTPVRRWRSDPLR